MSTETLTQSTPKPETQKPLPPGGLTWFEIPTGDIHRAREFFRAVLAAPLIDVSHDEPMYMFPPFGEGVTGAIVQREAQQPGPTGTVVYLQVKAPLAAAMERVEPAGGALLTPAMTVPNVVGTFCVIRDSEGNHVGLHAQS